MALRIELTGDKPGIAKLLIQKWQGSTDVDILIQRNQDGYYLADNGQWVAETFWHNVSNLTLDEGKLEGVVTNWLVDSLLSQENHVRFLVTVRDHLDESLPDQAIYSDRGAINIAENVLSSSALDSASRTDAPKVKSIPAEESPQIPPKEEMIEEEVVPFVIAPDADEERVQPLEEEITKPKKKRGIVILLLLIILLLIAGAVWYFLQQFSSFPASEPPKELVSECTITNAGDDDLLFIQQCLQTNPDSPSILQLINDAKAAGKCNIAQRLYANQSQKNSAIALMYAKEYDTKYYQSNACFQADDDTAAYWYETAQTLDPNNESSLIQSRLDALKKQ